jgi:uncharacterized membrane protein YdfJ with MMPL/SSD domain
MPSPITMPVDQDSGRRSPVRGDGYAGGVLERWVRIVLRFRFAVLVAWLVVLAAGVIAASQLPPLLSIAFDVPGTESAKAAAILERNFDERPDGSFTVVFRVKHPSDKRLQAQLRKRVETAAGQVPTGHAGKLRDGDGILYASIDTTLGLQEAARHTEALRKALNDPSGPRGYVTGQPAIQHDLDPVIAKDMRRGETLAIPVAFLVLLVVLGFSFATLVPFAFAACTIAATMLVVFGLAHEVTMATYLPILIELIGLGLAIDYSLLVVYRFREEVERTETTDEAVVRTMATAGRTVLSSGTAVAIGLALLLFMPVPFIRSMGIGGLLIPITSMAAMVTLQPVLLSLLGPRGARRYPVAAVMRSRLGLALPSLPGTSDVERGLWARIARTIMRRPLVFLVAATTLLVAAAIPAFFIQLTPGSLSGLPHALESTRGYTVLREGIGPGVITPTQVVVDTGTAGGARDPAVEAAVDRLGDRLFKDFELVGIASGPKPPYVDPTRRYARVVTAGVNEYGARSTQDYVKRVREKDVPAARFPEGTTVVVGGAPAAGVDYLARAYGTFPWLVLGALLLTFVVLMRAFRSLLLPLKAVLLNLLTVAAVYGLLVSLFSWGWGSGLLGLPHADEIEGWIPIFLFAVLFGLSMDYEVFIVSRMRESWDHVPDNARAVAHGLERTGRIVTAAAVIMMAAFLGFAGGRIVALQELGVGLALAVLIDATLVRAVLVPSLMAVVGRYNWWLPASLARMLRVAPSPLQPEARTAARTRGSAP